MRINCTITELRRIVLIPALAVLCLGFALVAGASQAHASDLAATALTTQADSSGTRILKSMVSFTDSKPFTATAYDDAPKVVNGDTTLSTSYYDWKLTNDGEGATNKVWTITGKTYSSTVYYGTVRVSYSISDESTAPEEGGDESSSGEEGASETGSAAEEKVVLASDANIDIAFKDATLTVTPGAAVKDFVTVEDDAQSGTVTVSGEEGTKLEGQKVVVSYSIEEGREITRDMVDIMWDEEDAGDGGDDGDRPNDGTEKVLVAVFDDGRSDEQPNLMVGEQATLEVVTAAHVESGDFDLAAGEFRIHVAGIAPYSGEVDIYGVFDDVEGEDGATHKVFSEKSPLRAKMVRFDADAFVYDGNAHVPEVTVREVVTVSGADRDSTVLTVGDQYTVAYENEKSATVTENGYKVTVAGVPSGGYVGAVTKSYDILGAAADYVASVSTAQKPTYTGSAIYPSIKISDGDGNQKTLTNGSSDSRYEIVWPDDMTNAGKKTILVKVKGADDTPDTLVAVDNGGKDDNPFEIVRASLTGATVSVSTSPTITYTGEQLEPSVTVTWSSRTLIEGVDYEVTYENNVKAKAASSTVDPPTATVTGLEAGNFSDKKAQTFTINAKSISSAEVGSIDNQVYTGSALTPVPSVTVDGVALKYQEDFTVTYYSNTNVGTSYGYIYGVNNYGSSKYVYPLFAIVGRPISDVTVAPIGTETYTGYSVQPRPTITYKGKTLTQGTDYTLSYEDNVNPGTATITITGKSTFAGSRTVQFNIGATGTTPKVKAKDIGGGAALLTWDPIYKATKYMISEKNTDGSYRVLSSSCLSTACTISNLSVTRNHRFIVRAYVDGKWSSKSEKLLVSVKPTGAKKPTVRAFSSTKTSVLLSWNSVPGADRYAIYERVGGTFQMRTDSYTATNAPVTQLKPKGKYTFYVQAHVDGKWSNVKKADYVTISPADPNPTAVVATTGVGKGKVKLKWSKSRNAKKYMVQAKTGKGKWKTLTKSCKKTSYVAKKLSPGKTYTFRVRAFGNGKWSKAYSEYYATATPDAA